MMNEGNENEDPQFYDWIGIDFDDICPSQESDVSVDHLQKLLCDPLYLSELYFKCDAIDFSEIPLSGIQLNRRDWLVEDSISKRQRSPRLFEFLILLLKNSNYETYASFTNKSKGIFQVHQPEKVAEFWQAVKSRQSNQKMTYDKFARAIRWYYKSNIMQKTNTRYTFQFAPELFRLNFADENNNTMLSLPSVS